MDNLLDNVDNKTKVYCIAISLVMLLSTVIVAMSFGTVEPTEYGLTYNSVSKNIN